MNTQFTIHSQCVADDATLYAHIESALMRQLPIVRQYEMHEGTAVIVGSGPSVLGQVEAIRTWKAEGAMIVALKDAHDWLIANQIIPHIAIAIDPQAARAKVFATPHRDVTYLLASQVHPEMLDHLKLFHIELWHAYIRKGQQVPPPGTALIAGGTTTGLRAMTLLYTMGFRTMELFGFDSSLTNGVLRLNGTVPRDGEQVHDVTVGGRTFSCSMSMLAQASEFQNAYEVMPDLTIHAHGDGLIPAIVRERAARPIRTTSFIHHMGPSAASFRYRAQIPAAWLNASLNDLTADVVVVSKPESVTIPEVKRCLGNGQSVIVDFCDDHFASQHYRDLVRLADAVTCCSDVLAHTILGLGREATVIHDPYESPECPAHGSGARLLWFGHALNLPDAKLERFQHYDLHIVSNAPNTIPWSPETMDAEWARADIVILPTPAPYKSANRAIESIRRGCFVVAEPHPSLTKIPGIWIGDIEEGIQWAIQHWPEANRRTALSQIYLSKVYDPHIVACVWSRAIQGCPSTWGLDVAAGPVGSMLIVNPAMSGVI